MPSKRRELTPEQVQMQKLIDLGCDQLDVEMKELHNQSASLISQWLLWEMATNEKSFEDVSIDLCRRFLKTHQMKVCAGAGAEVQAHLDEHTIDE